MYLRSEVRGRKSEYNQTGTQSNQQQGVVYAGVFSTLISQPSTAFLPWNISYWNNFLHPEFIHPSKTVTVAAYNKIEYPERKKYRLEKITRADLQNTLRILRYTLAHDISCLMLKQNLKSLTPLRFCSDFTI